MLLLRAEKIKKSYGERTLLEAEELSVYTNDKIGVVGANGAGKTTLFAILAGELEPDEGNIFRFGEISYCRQFEEEAADRHETAEERKGKESPRGPRKWKRSLR